MPMHPLLSTLRPHHWAKNLLLVLPAGAGHVPITPQLLLKLAEGIAAFSLMASASYITNDLMDVKADRLHPRKRDRPIAAGVVSTGAAAALGLASAALAILLAVQLSWLFVVVLLGYALLTLAYSVWLKRLLLIDVIVLASLYTVRVVAGAVIVDVRLTRWFLAFSIFLFFSLALVKRVRELRASGGAGITELPGRAYRPGDQETLFDLGAAATLATALVWCLYITSDDALRLYARPDVLWLGLPLLLYWQARVWIFTRRDAMHDDPVVFALRDKVSWIAAACFALALLIASR